MTEYNLFGVRGGTITGGKVKHGRKLWLDNDNVTPGAGNYDHKSHISNRGPDKSVSVAFNTAKIRHSRDIWSQQERRGRESPGTGRYNTNNPEYTVKGKRGKTSAFFSTANIGHGRDLWSAQEMRGRDTPGAGKYNNHHHNTMAHRQGSPERHGGSPSRRRNPQQQPSYMTHTARSRAKIKKKPVRTTSSNASRPGWGSNVRPQTARAERGRQRDREPRGQAYSKYPTAASERARSRSRSRATSARRNGHRGGTIVVSNPGPGSSRDVRSRNGSRPSSTRRNPHRQGTIVVSQSSRASGGDEYDDYHQDEHYARARPQTSSSPPARSVSRPRSAHSARRTGGNRQATMVVSESSRSLSRSRSTSRAASGTTSARRAPRQAQTVVFSRANPTRPRSARRTPGETAEPRPKVLSAYPNKSGRSEYHDDQSVYTTRELSSPSRARGDPIQSFSRTSGYEHLELGQALDNGSKAAAQRAALGQTSPRRTYSPVRSPTRAGAMAGSPRALEKTAEREGGLSHRSELYTSPRANAALHHEELELGDEKGERPNGKAIALSLEEQANELFRNNIAWAMEQPSSRQEFAL